MIIKKTHDEKKIETKRSAWSWVPSLYFAEGLPYVIVMFVAGIMYKRMGISNADIALYTGWLYLPWVIKPLWSPLVDLFKTKRSWIYTMQFIIGAGMAGVALTIPMPDFFQFTLAFFWLLAFSSATHDIAADGFYMLALSESQQSFFVGIRSTFYKLAMIVGQGLIVILAGYLESTMALGPADIKVVANPNKFFQETIKVDSISTKELAGNLRILAKPSYVEISTQPKTNEQVNFYKSFAHNFNIMNGFSKEAGVITDTATNQNLAGNVGIVKLQLSKKPSDGKEYDVSVDLHDGNEGIKVIEGQKLKFTSINWNKPAFVVFQLDSTISQKNHAEFYARTEKLPLAWVFTFVVIGGLFILFFIYHRFILPQPVEDEPAVARTQVSVLKGFFRTFFRFFEKKRIIVVILFLLFYRFGESQLQKMAPYFMMDGREIGGLGLSTIDVGFLYGTVGMVALMLGGILGGFAISSKGLKFWLWPMLLAINIPHALYVYLAYAQPTNIWIIYGCVAGEQFFYGFGFTAFLMYMMYVSEGEFKTSHYAIATGFMALGMMVPGMFSGMIEEALGYKLFFVWVLVSMIPSFIIAKFIPLQYSYGKKKITE
jgi:MFS transporter, PAT family, beta-lactamase induction signal transducer AmpG